MGTFGQSKKTANKERNKSIMKANIAQRKVDESRLASTDNEIIQMDIALTESRIRNVEADIKLNPDNKMIKIKLRYLNDILINKQKQLKEDDK